MPAPPSSSPPSQSSPRAHGSAQTPRGAPSTVSRQRWPARLPLPMVLFAVPTIVIGLLGAIVSVNFIAAALADRRAAVLQLQEQVVQAQKTIDPAGTAGSLTRLPKPELERLGGLLGDEFYRRRGAQVPLGALNLLLCWLLTTGALGALRRRPFAVSMWRFAALVNVPFSGLALLVVAVRTRGVAAAVSPAAAEAMAAVSKRPVADELAALQALTQAGLRGLALWYVTLALFFTASALYLRRAVPDDDPV